MQHYALSRIQRNISIGFLRGHSHMLSSCFFICTAANCYNPPFMQISFVFRKLDLLQRLIFFGYINRFVYEFKPLNPQESVAKRNIGAKTFNVQKTVTVKI